MTELVESPVDAKRLGRPRDEARETAILEAALTVISEVGYDRATMDGIAARAHSSKATIYRRWPNKGTLVAAAVRCRAGDHVAFADTGSLRGDLIDSVGAIATQMEASDLGLLTGIFAAIRTDPELAEAIRTMMFAEKYEMIAPMFRRALARGDVVKEDAPLLFHEIVPPLIINRLTVTNLPVDAAYLDHVVDDVLIPVFTFNCPQLSQATPRKDHTS